MMCSACWKLVVMLCVLLRMLETMESVCHVLELLEVMPCLVEVCDAWTGGA